MFTQLCQIHRCNTPATLSPLRTPRFPAQCRAWHGRNDDVPRAKQTARPQMYVGLYVVTLWVNPKLKQKHSRLDTCSWIMFFIFMLLQDTSREPLSAECLVCTVLWREFSPTHPAPNKSTFSSSAWIWALAICPTYLLFVGCCSCLLLLQQTCFDVDGVLAWNLEVSQFQGPRKTQRMQKQDLKQRKHEGTKCKEKKGKAERSDTYAEVTKKDTPKKWDRDAMTCTAPAV